MERASAASVASTPLGRVTGYFAIRDMADFLGDDAEHFAANTGGARLAIGHDALGGGDDGDAESVHDARQLVAPLVHAQSRGGHALDFLDHGLVRVVLQADLELRLAFLLADGEAVDVSLVLQHLGDRNLDLGRRNADHGLSDHLGVADAGQHVGNGIGHAHAENLLPARLDQARDLPAQRDLAQLVAPKPELAEHSARTAGQAAAVAQPHGRGVPGQLLLLLARLLAVFVRAPGVVDDCDQRRAPGGELGHRLAAFFGAVDHGEFGHADPSGLERKAEGGEQRARLVVGFRGGRNADVEPSQGVDLVVFDFRKDDLLLDTEAVVAAAVECAARNAAEVTDTRDRHGD